MVVSAPTNQVWTKNTFGRNGLQFGYSEQDASSVCHGIIGQNCHINSALSCFSTDVKLTLGISMYSNTFSLECLSTARMDAQIECSWNIFHWDWFGFSLLCTYISNEKTILPSSNQADVCDNVDWKLQFLQSFIYWPMYKFIWWFMDFQKN